MAARRVSIPQLLLSCALMCAVGTAAVTPLRAGWVDAPWTTPLQAFGFAAGTSAPPLETVAAFIKAQPEPPKGSITLAAHAGSEGHWTFINRRGETFTVGTPEEMRRLASALAPDITDTKAPLTIHLSDATVFERAALLKELPAGATLSLVVGATSFPLSRTRDGATGKLRAAVRSRLHIVVGERSLFDEALRQLSRPLDRQVIRVLSLEPGGPQTLVRSPKPDTPAGRPPVDAIDPYKLPAALSALSGQTAVVSGRIAGQYLAFRPPSGGEATILAGDVTAAAARANVDVVIVQSATPHQPGARNWLWQRFAIDGLDKAIGHATFADFLETLAGGRGPVILTLEQAGTERIVMHAGPPDAATGAGIGGILQEVAAGITGAVAPTVITAHLTSTQHRRELSLRLLPMLPSTWQAVYAGLLGLGLLGLGTARRWWARWWPPEQRADYAGAFGYHAARGAKFAAFLAVFLPLAGPLACAATVGGLITQLLRRLRGEVSPGTPQAG